ncbi:hypothetical protein AAFN85_03105 [Mucilaginibacter sp. CAU 1740]|uniref:hypothetical protein n=1 Tax=Mucilaginibacter sp. CAU 1740 TaxID=3140365 RepID=UPI00325C0097
MITKEGIFGYEPDPQFETSIAYFSMQFAIDQSLKIYSGGLGFLAGSHLRSAYALKQNCSAWACSGNSAITTSCATQCLVEAGIRAKGLFLFRGYRPGLNCARS